MELSLSFKKSFEKTADIGSSLLKKTIGVGGKTFSKAAPGVVQNVKPKVIQKLQAPAENTLNYKNLKKEFLAKQRTLDKHPQGLSQHTQNKMKTMNAPSLYHAEGIGVNAKRPLGPKDKIRPERGPSF